MSGVSQLGFAEGQGAGEARLQGRGLIRMSNVNG